MSQLLIQQYLNDLQTLRRVSGTSRESVVREAFKTLLKDWGKSHDLIFVPEYEYSDAAKERALSSTARCCTSCACRSAIGRRRTRRTTSTPRSRRSSGAATRRTTSSSRTRTQAVLIQNRQRGDALRRSTDVDALEKLLELFFGYERAGDRRVPQGGRAVQGRPAGGARSAARHDREGREATTPAFRKAAIKFLKHAQETINPSVTAADVREMLIQHILTEEIFSQVFDDSRLPPRRTTSRKELYALEETFFTGEVKHKTLAGLRPYYAAIRAPPRSITSHHEKQTFLKMIYENFYKVYNKKAADRLGVVYTPNEIVRFMIESADWLCQKHFGKQLIDKNVEILDPAAGTGTFITELIEHFRGQPAKLQHKYLRGTARQRGGDPALLRRQPEHRGDLRGDHRRVRGIPEPLLRRHARQRRRRSRTHAGQQRRPVRRRERGERRAHQAAEQDARSASSSATRPTTPTS